MSYCCFAFAVAMRELSKMKRRRKKKAKHTTVSDSDIEDDFDDDNEQVDEKDTQGPSDSNDLLLTNEHAIKNEVVIDSEAVVSSAKTTAVSVADHEARPSISVTSKADSKLKTAKEQDQESQSRKPVYTTKPTKPRKKVEFVIELPVITDN